MTVVIALCVFFRTDKIFKAYLPNPTPALNYWGQSLKNKLFLKDYMINLL